MFNQLQDSKRSCFLIDNMKGLAGIKADRLILLTKCCGPQNHCQCRNILRVIQLPGLALAWARNARLYTSCKSGREYCIAEWKSPVKRTRVGNIKPVCWRHSSRFWHLLSVYWKKTTKSVQSTGWCYTVGHSWSLSLLWQTDRTVRILQIIQGPSPTLLNALNFKIDYFC